MLEIPDEKTLERIGKRIALVILFIAWCMICWMLFKVFTAEPTARPPRTLPEYIEIHPNGRMLYMVNGKRCEITNKEEGDDGNWRGPGC